MFLIRIENLRTFEIKTGALSMTAEQVAPHFEPGAHSVPGRCSVRSVATAQALRMRRPTGETGDPAPAHDKLHRSKWVGQSADIVSVSSDGCVRV